MAPVIKELENDLSIDPFTDLDEQVSKWNSTLSALLNSHAPVETKEIIVRHECT